MTPEEIKAKLIENLEDQLDTVDDLIRTFEDRIESDTKSIERQKKKQQAINKEIADLKSS